MKKGVKITLWVLGTLVFLFIATMLSIDIVASRVVQSEVRKTFERMPDADAMVGGIFVNLLSGSAIVRDITFCTNSLAIEDTITGIRKPGLALHIPTLAVWNINYMELIRHHRLSVLKVTVDQPKVLVYLDEKHPELLIPEFPKDTTIEKAGSWLHAIDVHFIELNKSSAKLHSTRTPLFVSADSLSFSCQNIHYGILDSVFTYNDSVYSLNLEACHVSTPDGLFGLEVHDLNTKNQGELKLGYTRIRNLFPPKELADLMREPTTWIDLEVNSVSTSAFNPIRKVLAQDCTLDKIQVDVRRMHVVDDQRHAPKKPFSTPQDFLLKQVPLTFRINQVIAKVRKADIESFSTDINCGQLHLKNMVAQMKNVTNKRGATWSSSVKAPFGEKGFMEAHYDMRMDRAATFDVKIAGKDIETKDMNTFLRPLVGMTCACHIDRLDAAFHGDREISKGTFCMQYHGLEVEVHKEDDIPYKVITKNAGAIKGFANNMIPKSNPTSVDPRPRQYDVEWKNDVWKPYPLFVFGPCIDGVVKTMLPGLFVHKQTKQKKGKK